VEEEKGSFKVTDRRIHLDETAQAAPSKEGQTREPSSSHSESRPIDFSGFLVSLGTSAMIHLGEEAHPALGKVEINLDQAKELIDLLALLEEKTQGNLTENERELFTKLLFTLRMKFIEVSSRKQPASS
jgi:Domain of unknown function (DUF1844)